MRTIPLVLLPGLDGTGEQFAPLVAELPPTIAPLVVRYPTDRVLGYDELLPLALAHLPRGGPFILLGESFSGPLSIRIAATSPDGLRALVLVATFHRRPVPRWLAMLRPFVRDASFTRPPPAFALRKLLLGADAQDELVASFRASVGSVRADVLATRARAALDVDVSAALAEVKVPITYFAASDDGLVRREIPEELRAIVPSLEVRAFDAPHLLLQRRPREAAAAIALIAARS